MEKPLLKIAIFLTLCLLFLHACDHNRDPLAVDDMIYETAYGTVAQVDSYPLFTFRYSSDYQFAQYLQDGQFPDLSAKLTVNRKFACTCFSAFGDQTRLLGRNYDWPQHSSYFLVFTDPPDGYASVSTVDLSFFNYDHNQPPHAPDNQEILSILPYFPFDGMNEKGVAVGMNALSSGQGPSDPEKVTIGELQAIRLILDYAATTTQALALFQQYNILMEDPPIHYVIADSSGHSAIVELIDGQMLIMENEQPWQVTTNFIINGLEDWHHAPCWRYQTACQTLSAQNGNLSESEAIAILQTVSVSGTRWSTVFDLKSGQMKIVMGRNFENLLAFSVY